MTTTALGGTIYLAASKNFSKDYGMMKSLKGNGGGKLSNQKMNEYRWDVLSGKDVNFKTKQDALDFLNRKFPKLKQETAGGRSSEGWHFDNHSIKGGNGTVNHINIYSKQQGFRVHITWGE